MDKLTDQQVRKLIQSYCKPLIYILLENGISAKQLIDVAKDCYVNVASSEFGLRGRAANISRISIMTGISRKEVKKYRERARPDSELAPSSASPIGRILAAWHNDPEFVDSQGIPKSLTYDGEKNSFSSLSRKYIGDIPASALLRELERNQLVEEDDEGRIRPLEQTFIPKQMDHRSLERLGEVVGELGGTVLNNLRNQNGKRFERRVLSGNISSDEAHIFHNLVQKQGNKFLEFLESWLYEQGLSDVELKDSGSRRAGVGVYFFEEDVTTRQYD